MATKLTPRRIFTLTAGLALMAAGFAGLFFSLVGLVALARLEHNINAGMKTTLDLMDDALGATSDGLLVAGASLDQVEGTIGSLQATTLGVGAAITGTVPTLEVMADLMGGVLPQTITTTQQALEAAQVSAKLVDDTLLLLTAVPFIGTATYNPEHPLSESIGAVADSLDPLPVALIGAQTGLLTAVSNLEAIQVQVGEVSTGIGAIAGSVGESLTVIEQYQAIVADLQEQMGLLRLSVPRWLRTARWSLSLVLIWLGVAQLGLLTQGWELVGRSRPRA